MNNFIYSLIIGTLTVIDGGLIFVIALGLELALFLAVLLVSLLVRLYSLKKRVWYFVSSIAVLALQLGFLSVAKQTELSCFTLGVTLLLWCVVIALPERKLKVSNKQRELARILDQTAKDLEPKEFSVQTIKTAQAQPLQPPQPQTPYSPPVQNADDARRFELDFQHVKSVTQKLEYYPLTASDKKVVKELEDNIYIAETEGFTGLLKSKINDGLGALLKIMSKYGV